MLLPLARLQQPRQRQMHEIIIEIKTISYRQQWQGQQSS